MTPLPPHLAQRRRALKLLVTVAVGAAALWFFTTSARDSTESTTVSTQSLLTIPRLGESSPTPVATTAPLDVPTPTAAPTPSATPTAAATPTASPTVPPTPDAGAESASAAPASSLPAVRAADSAPAASQDPTSAPATGPSPTAPVVILPAAPVITPTPTPPAIVLPAVVLPTPTVAPTATSAPVLAGNGQAEAYALGRVNAVRGQAGLGPLTLDPALSAIALDWSRHMSVNGFYHRPGAQLSSMLPAGWQQWGENIVTITAVDIAAAQESLERSPGHYQNMVGPFTNVGIGVYVVNGQLWMTQVFARY